MFSRFEWMVAMRYLRPRRKEGFVSIIALFSFLGILLGVATLIIVMSVMNGFREELMSRILGLNGHLSVYAPAEGLDDYDPLADRILDVDGVTQVTPMVEGQVMVTANGAARGAVVRGLTPEDLKGRAILSDNIVRGAIERFGEEPGVVIGARMAERMGLGVGSQLSMISPKGHVTAFGTMPRVASYPVIGIFEIGMFEYDSGFVFMPLSAAQTYFQLPGRVTNLEIFTKSAEEAPKLLGDIAGVARGQGQVRDWQRVNASFFNAVQVERNVMFIILTLIIVVAAFNIISSLIMLVKGKGRDIAILRTIGASRGTIMRIFLISGASIGVVGTVFGFLAGLAFSLNIETIRQWIQGLTGTELFAAEIYFLSRLPAVVDPMEVVTVVTMALILSFLATIYPSWRAARIDPAEALRYE